MYKAVLIIVTFLFVMQSQAKRAKGTWQDYLSYVKATKIAIAQDKIYCATEGGVMFYDLQDNSINKLSNFVELSDFGIKTIAYGSNDNVLIIAYNNSNIDLIYDNTVVNLSDIKRKQMTGEKTINNISFYGHEAYLSCGFGIVLLNLEKNEIKDTYYIGENGNALNVNDVEIFNNTIYAATDNGIYKADVNESNLLDYNNWTKEANIPHSNDKFNKLAVHANKLIANYTPDEWYSDEMFALNGNYWESWLPQIKYAFDIQENGNNLTITSRDNVYLVDENNSIVKIINKYQLGDREISPIQARSAGVTPDGTIWIADYNNSLIKVFGENYESVNLNGPLDNDIFSLYQNGTDLWIAPGNKKGYETPRFQVLKDGQWEYFTKVNYPELDDGFFNIIDIIADPSDQEHIFVASWGGGLLEFRNNQFVQRYTNHNSPLESALPAQPDEPYVRIGGFDFDSEGNLWMSNSEVAKNLVKLTPQGEWESVVLPGVANDYSIGDVLVTQNDDKWILLPSGHDVYVVDKNGTQKKHLLITSYFNNGTDDYFTRMNDVYSIAEDNNGDIWIGTSKGVAVYNDPGRIWRTENLYATQPGLDLNDGIYHPLLETETVTAIAVDGANRKWLGTSGSGVYLVSENGENEIQHFTKENSPLLSNTINAIAINQQSGEVFLGTDEGLISYMGDAIEGENAFKNVYVYPNPVRENYNGPVIVTGLMENTDIKITDISGNLVYTTKSLGGEAIWDGNNLNGNRVKTGVYMVFCTNKDGSQTHIAKLLFIH